jgi:hypothetical protein
VVPYGYSTIRAMPQCLRFSEENMPTARQAACAFSADVVIIGGCGRVGLPPGVAMLIVGAPGPVYRGLVTDKPVADIWGVAGRGMRI